MNEEQLDRTMREWAAREERSAPEIRPSEAVRRRLGARGERRGGLPPWGRTLGWAAAAAVLVGAWFAVRAVLESDHVVPEHVAVVSEEIGRAVTFEGATLTAPRRGGPKSAPRGFAQLVFQRHVFGDHAIRGVDLLAPERESLVLAVGERYRLGLRLHDARHVWVFQTFGTGDGGEGVTCLWGGGAADGDRVPAGTPRWIPAEPQWFEVLSPAGQEEVHVVASPDPVPALVELAARARGARTAGAHAELAETLRRVLAGLPDEAQVVSFAFRSTD